MKLLLAAFLATAAAAAPITLDLAVPFATRSPWRLTTTPAADIADPIGSGGEQVPGPIAVCLSKDSGRSCDPSLRNALGAPTGRDDLFAEPHFVEEARVVTPRPGLRLLLVRLASLHSGNGDQRVGTRLLAYDRAADRFVVAYAHVTGRNNNQEVRYVGDGPLRGAVVAAEPTQEAPFGFWITVSRPNATGIYRQALRYRSATRYGDGNPLAVIDSEMPALQQRLGLWRPGQPLPLPRDCGAPRLVRMELWCAPSGKR